jgi:hypothetical protein
MMINIERFKADIERLVQQGELLEYAMGYEADKKAFVEQVQSVFKKKSDADDLLKKLPNFKVEYEAWYSESLALLRQLLPERVANFISFYEKPKARNAVTYGEYFIQDYLQGLRVTRHGSEVVVDSKAAIPQFQQQLAIVKAASRRFESSLFEIRQLVQADIFDNEIAAARELLRSKFLRAAGAIAGVVLEKHLLQVCDDHSVKVAKKNPGIGDLNDLNELLKAASVIDIPQWRHISMLGDLRNLCVHNKKKEPTDQQVSDLIDGTDKILKTIA